MRAVQIFIEEISLFALHEFAKGLELLRLVNEPIPNGDIQVHRLQLTLYMGRFNKCRQGRDSQRHIRGTRARAKYKYRPHINL